MELLGISDYGVNVFMELKTRTYFLTYYTSDFDLEVSIKQDDLFKKLDIDSVFELDMSDLLELKNN